MAFSMVFTMKRGTRTEQSFVRDGKQASSTPMSPQKTTICRSQPRPIRRVTSIGDLDKQPRAEHPQNPLSGRSAQSMQSLLPLFSVPIAVDKCQLLI